MSLVDKLGGRDEQYEQEEQGFNFTNVGRFDDKGTYTHRVIAGPKRIEYVWYPCVREDNDTGEPYSSSNRLALLPRAKMDDGQKFITDKLAAIDRKIQEEHNVPKDRIRSTFDRTTRYLYIVISRDRSKQNDIWIGGWEYPASISKELRDLQKEESTSNKGMLNLGPYWTYDVNIIKKEVDGLYGIDYSIRAEQSTVKYAGQIPIEVVTGDKDALRKNKDLLQEVQNNVFTPEELEAIDDYMESHSLDDLIDVYESNEEILQEMNNRPINLIGKRKSGKKIIQFPHKFSQMVNNKMKDNLLPETTELEEELNTDELEEGDEQELNKSKEETPEPEKDTEEEAIPMDNKEEEVDIDDEVEEIEEDDIW
jgi:hypothetical protein